MDLRELAIRYSSDKYWFHSYIPEYEKLFAGMKVSRLLEIGVGERGLMQPFLPKDVEYCHGSSLKMFRDYFPEAEIYGADIREDVLFQEERIHTKRCDQSSPTDLIELIEWTGTDLDVVIDDASHIHELQRTTLQVLLPYLKSGAVWITEDVWPDKGQELAKEFGGELWRGEKGRDDNLVVIRK